MYNKEVFGKELKNKILNKVPADDIGHWAYSIYLKEDVDPEFDDILLTLNTMEEGPEFIFTYLELEQIADDLIAGKEKLIYDSINHCKSQVEVWNASLHYTVKGK